MQSPRNTNGAIGVTLPAADYFPGAFLIGSTWESANNAGNGLYMLYNANGSPSLDDVIPLKNRMPDGTDNQSLLMLTPNGDWKRVDKVGDTPNELTLEIMPQSYDYGYDDYPIPADDGTTFTITCAWADDDGTGAITVSIDDDTYFYLSDGSTTGSTLTFPSLALGATQTFQVFERAAIIGNQQATVSVAAANLEDPIEITVSGAAMEDSYTITTAPSVTPAPTDPYYITLTCNEPGTSIDSDGNVILDATGQYIMFARTSATDEIVYNQEGIFGGLSDMTYTLWMFVQGDETHKVGADGPTVTYTPS